jgi:hypothetical protein
LHTLLDDVEHIKARLEKEVKQQEQASGKRKREKKVREDTHETSQSITESLTDNFDGELEQLTLSDVPEDDLGDLEPLSEEEFEA